MALKHILKILLSWELILQIGAFGAQWDLSYKQGIINRLRNFFNT